MPRLAAPIGNGLRDVARLLLPVECPGCGLWDEVLCGSCARVLAGPVRRCEDAAPRLDRMDGPAALPVWRVTPYAGPARGIVVAWKDRGRADLNPVLVAAVRRGARDLGPLLAEAAPGGAVHVVPVPSTPGARRRRGADLVGLLALGVAAGLGDAGADARVSALLVRDRGGRDQVGLGARARGRNSAGSFRLRRGLGGGRRPAAGGAHLLVDDVLTTGSTLASCDEVLTGGGALVLGAFVLAATPPPSRDRRLLLGGPDGD